MCQPAQRAAIIAHPSRPVNLYLEEIPIHVFAFELLWERFHLALVVKVFRARRAEQQGTVNIALTVKSDSTIIALPLVVGHVEIIPFFFCLGQLLSCTPETQKLAGIAGPVDLTASNAHGGDKLNLNTLGLVGLVHGVIVPFFFSSRQLPVAHALPQLPLGALHLTLRVTLATPRVLLELAALALRDFVHVGSIDDLKARWKRLTIFFILLLLFLGMVEYQPRLLARGLVYQLAPCLSSFILHHHSHLR